MIKGSSGRLSVPSKSREKMTLIKNEVVISNDVEVYPEHFFSGT